MVGCTLLHPRLKRHVFFVKQAAAISWALLQTAGGKPKEMLHRHSLREQQLLDCTNLKYGGGDDGLH
jgi:hypothetical protein